MLPPGTVQPLPTSMPCTACTACTPISVPPVPHLEVQRGLHVHERQRYKLGDAARAHCQAPEGRQVAGP